MGNASSGPETVWFHDFEKELPSLEGKTIVVTGCTSGTGLVVARTSVRKAAKDVLMLNRPSERAEKAEKEVKEAIPEGTKVNVETIPCDLQDFESVKNAINRITEKYESIDVLCNNAGVANMNDYATKDGYDVQMQTNHLSHFMLTKGLFPLLKRAQELRGEARICNHSSGVRGMGRGPLKSEYFGKNGGNLGGNSTSFFSSEGNFERYHQSKLANSVFTMALKERLPTGIKASVAAPGMAATSLAKNSEGMPGSSWVLKFAQSAEDGSMPLLAACFSPETENGDFWEPSKFGAMYGPATKVKYGKYEQDPEQQKMLWETSEEACGKFEM